MGSPWWMYLRMILRAPDRLRLVFQRLDRRLCVRGGRGRRPSSDFQLGGKRCDRQLRITLSLATVKHPGDLPSCAGGCLNSGSVKWTGGRVRRDGRHTVWIDRQAVVDRHVKCPVSSKLPCPRGMIEETLERLNRPDRDDMSMGYPRRIDDLQASVSPFTIATSGDDVERCILRDRSEREIRTDLPAKRVRNGLMSQTHAEDGYRRRVKPEEIEGKPNVLWIVSPSPSPSPSSVASLGS